MLQLATDATAAFEQAGGLPTPPWWRWTYPTADRRRRGCHGCRPLPRSRLGLGSVNPSANSPQLGEGASQCRPGIDAGNPRGRTAPGSLALERLTGSGGVFGPAIVTRRVVKRRRGNMGCDLERYVAERLADGLDALRDARTSVAWPPVCRLLASHDETRPSRRPIVERPGGLRFPQIPSRFASNSRQRQQRIAKVEADRSMACSSVSRVSGRWVKRRQRLLEVRDRPPGRPSARDGLGAGLAEVGRPPSPTASPGRRGGPAARRARPSRSG